MPPAAGGCSLTPNAERRQQHITSQLFTPPTAAKRQPKKIGEGDSGCRITEGEGLQQAKTPDATHKASPTAYFKPAPQQPLADSHPCTFCECA
jgi:hypothetical protein